MSEKSIKIEVQLASGNYSEWRIKMFSLLVLKDIQEVLEEDIQQDPAQLPAVADGDAAALLQRSGAITAFNQWHKSSIKVRALIELNINKHNSERIRKLQHGRSAWEALEAYHNSNTVGNLQRLQEKINNM